MILNAPRAEPMYDGQPQPEFDGLHFTDRLPKFSDWAQWGEYCTEEARIIESVLYSNLPGGVYDRVLAKMMLRKASLLAVSHSPTPPPAGKVSEGD